MGGYKTCFRILLPRVRISRLSISFPYRSLDYWIKTPCFGSILSEPTLGYDCSSACCNGVCQQQWLRMTHLNSGAYKNTSNDDRFGMGGIASAWNKLHLALVACNLSSIPWAAVLEPWDALQLCEHQATLLQETADEVERQSQLAPPR